MTFLCQKTIFGMLQMEFNTISHMKIFLVALFHTKHFRPQAARVRTFLTLLHSIFLLVFFYVANYSLDMATDPFLRLHNFSLFHFLKIYSSYFIMYFIVRNARKSTSPKHPFYDFLWTQAFIFDWHRKWRRNLRRNFMESEASMLQIAGANIQLIGISE